MTIFDVTGYRYPNHWRETFEVCGDSGHGAKVGEYEQFILSKVEEEMRAIYFGMRVVESHHNDLMMCMNTRTETTDVEEWIEVLMDDLKEINNNLQGDSYAV